MKWVRIALGLIALIALASSIDRYFLKKNKGFSLAFIESPLEYHSEWESSAPFPEKILSQPFTYLGKGAQNFVFESEDKTHVIKFYHFPSHMRKIPWLKHPFSYHFSPRRQKIKEYNLSQFALTYTSYHLALTHLPEETGVVYTHLNPTKTLGKKLTLIDALGSRYEVALDEFGFVVQKKGKPFLPLYHEAVAKGDKERAAQMIQSLVELLKSRCQKGICDLDAMGHDNYGFVGGERGEEEREELTQRRKDTKEEKGRAIHLDIGRFVLKREVASEAGMRDEILRVTTPLREVLDEEMRRVFEEALVAPGRRDAQSQL